MKLHSSLVIVALLLVVVRCHASDAPGKPSKSVPSKSVPSESDSSKDASSKTAKKSARSPYERNLVGDDAAKALDLHAQMRAAEKSQEFDTAIKLAEELLEFRTRLQGADHWQTVTIKWELDVAKRTKSLNGNDRKALQSLLDRLAELNSMANNDAKVLSAMGDLRNVYEKIFGEQHPSTAVLYGNMAAVLASQKKSQLAEGLARQSLGLLRRLLGEEHPDTLQAYTLIAQILDRRDRFAEAQGHYEQAIRISKAISGEVALRTISECQLLGGNLSIQGKYDDAHNVLTTALNLVQEKHGEKHSQVAQLYVYIADNMVRQDKFREAKPLAERAVELATEVLGETHETTADCISSLANIMNHSGNLEESQKLCERALNIRRNRLGETHPATLMSYHSLANILASRGKLFEARAELQKIIDIERKEHGEKSLHLVRAYADLATISDSLAKYSEAQVLHERALNMAKVIFGEEHAETAARYGGLGQNLELQGRFGESLTLYERQLNLFLRKLGDKHQQTAIAHRDVARILRALGRHTDAEPHFRKAWQINRDKLGETNEKTIVSFKSYADSLLAVGKQEEAKTLIERLSAAQVQSPGEDRPLTEDVYLAQGINAFRSGKIEETQKLYEKALEVVKNRLGETHPRSANVLLQLAYVVSARGRYDEALRLAEQAVATYRKSLGEGHPETSIAYQIVAINYLAVQKPLAALENLKQAANSFEIARVSAAKKSFDRALFGVEYSPYKFLSAIHAHMGSAEEAWLAAEANLARGINDALALRRGFEFLGDERRRHEEIETRMVRVDARLSELDSATSPTPEKIAESDKLRLERRELNVELSKLTEELRRREIASLAKVQAAIPEDGALIFWIDGFDYRKIFSFRWGCVVRRRGPPIWIPLTGTGPNREWTQEDEELPDRFRKSMSELTDLNLREMLDTGDKLFRQRFRPLMEHLEGVKHLFVIPVEPMAKIPVDLLYNPGVVSYVPSGTMLAKLSQKVRPMTQGILAVGDPYFRQRGSRERPKSLPGSRISVYRISKLFPSNAKVLAGTSASEQNLVRINQRGELSTYRHVLIDTHGNPNDDQPFESSLQLSQDYVPTIAVRKPGESLIDSELSAREILDTWKLDADLVTLSSCSSSLGRSGDGDGLLGFAQAILAAGSRAVCLTLWPVYDTPTCLLMTRFYQNLTGAREGLMAPMAKAEALNEARNWLSELKGPELIRLVDTSGDGMEKGSWKDLKLDLTDELRKACSDPNSRPYSLPIFWASFVIVGDPR